MIMYNQSLGCKYKYVNIGYRGLKEIMQQVPGTQNIWFSIVVILEKRENISVLYMHTGDKLVRLS